MIQKVRSVSNVNISAFFDEKNVNSKYGLHILVARGGLEPPTSGL